MYGSAEEARLGEEAVSMLVGRIEMLEIRLDRYVALHGEIKDPLTELRRKLEQ